MWVFILSFLLSAFKNFSLYKKMNKQRRHSWYPQGAMQWRNKTAILIIYDKCHVGRLDYAETREINCLIDQELQNGSWKESLATKRWGEVDELRAGGCVSVLKIVKQYLQRRANKRECGIWVETESFLMSQVQMVCRQATGNEARRQTRVRSWEDWDPTCRSLNCILADGGPFQISIRGILQAVDYRKITLGRWNGLTLQ